MYPICETEENASILLKSVWTIAIVIPTIMVIVPQKIIKFCIGVRFILWYIVYIILIIAYTPVLLITLESIMLIEAGAAI